MAKQKVIIIGGGVAGMTAAHELTERGGDFDVMVLERRTDLCGGKARTEPVRDSATGGRRPLPGEHGFRFFPGFYKHINDTMRRIPFGQNPHGVFDNLVTCEQGLFACAGMPPRPMVAHFPDSLDSLVHTMRFGMQGPEMMQELGLTTDDLTFYFQRLFQIATSCDERRFGEYERIGWWQFVDADKRSPAYQRFLATGVTRSAVATQAERANTRTIGVIGLQLIYNMITPGESADRVLVGPTTEAWLNPWLEHLRGRGVRYELGRTVSTIHFDGRVITGVDVSGMGRLEADHYILAVPVEVAARLLGDDLKDYDPTLKNLEQLQSHVNWMNGIQFYLHDDLALTKGHINALDTPWALTALFQQQFWPWSELSQYGDGSIRSILSVDISAWDVDGTPDGPAGGKKAQDCTPDEVAAETWFQLRRSLNTDAERLPAGYASYWLDDDLQRIGTGPRRPRFLGERRGKWFNLEPMLVNLTGAWALRPEAYTRIPNLALAGDYVRTHTDFASMEAACEAGRRAANVVFSAAGVNERADVWPLDEPEVFEPLKDWDRRRYARGQPWAPITDAPDDVLGAFDDARDRLRAAGAALLQRLSPVPAVTGLAQRLTKLIAPKIGEAFDRAREVIEWGAAHGVEIPSGLWFSYQEWRDLGFAHWRVPEAVLRQWVPAELEIESFGGSAWLTLVPMRMERLLLPVMDPPGCDGFGELNLRTYVRHAGRRGVYFIQIDAESAFAAWAADFLTGTHYRPAERVDHASSGNTVSIDCVRADHAGRFAARFTATGGDFVPSPGTIEAFLLDQYASFTVHDGEVSEGRLVHPSWQVRRATVEIEDNTLLARYGLGLDVKTPDLVLTSAGAQTVMWPFRRIG